MAWANTQGNKATSSSTTIACAFTSAPAVGSTLVFVVIQATATFSSMHDTIGNTYTDLGKFTDPSRGECTEAWACVNTTNSANTCTVTTSLNATWEAVVFEFSGGPSTVQQSGSVTGLNITTANPIITPSFTALAGDLLINSAVANGTVTFNSPWATGSQVTTNGDGAAFLLNVSAGANTPNWSDSTTTTNDVSTIWGLKIGGPTAAATFMPRRMPLGA